MKTAFDREALLAEFRRYLEWESQSFEGWEAVEIFVADTLSEAWLMARPGDARKFRKAEFKRKVDLGNGKWLEKQSASDTYKVILSTKNCRTIQELTGILVHELRHCLDYQNAVKDLDFEEYRPGNLYYYNWSEFRAMYALTRYEYFSRKQDGMTPRDLFNLMGEILGKRSADVVAGLMGSRDDMEDTLYFISRYIGASRAIRNLNMQEGIDSWVYHLWNMTPHYIIENFDYVFYIGNEWDATESCSLDAVPSTYYYEALISRIQRGKE